MIQIHPGETRLVKKATIAVQLHWNSFCLLLIKNLWEADVKKSYVSGKKFMLGALCKNYDVQCNCQWVISGLTKLNHNF